MAIPHDYDTDLRMFRVVARELDAAHLGWLRWLAERGRFEELSDGPPYSLPMGPFAPAPAAESPLAAAVPVVGAPDPEVS